jgi:hypothetical protein
MVRDGERSNLVAPKAAAETVQAGPHHGKMFLPTSQGVNMEANVLNAETLLALPLEALQATLLSVLTGDLKAKDGSLVPVEKAATGPRGPTAKVAPRLEACQALLVQMAGQDGGVTAKALLEAGGGAFLYTDILLVARNLLAEGTIQESRHGRKATWNSTTNG